jgi:hypothetical protein
MIILIMQTNRGTSHVFIGTKLNHGDPTNRQVLVNSSRQDALGCFWTTQGTCAPEDCPIQYGLKRLKSVGCPIIRTLTIKTLIEFLFN